MFGKPEAYAFGPIGKSETAGLLCSGRTEAAFAARARFKVGHEFKLGLHDRQHDELCKPLEGFEHEGFFAPVPGADHQFSLVVGIDEADKVEMQGVPFRNFSYLINRRYEEQLQTILLCNANDMEELKTKFGGSIIDRFRSNTWPAEILDLTAAKSHRGKEETA